MSEYWENEIADLETERDALRARVAELEAENATLRAHRCEVGIEARGAMLAHLKSLPPAELEALNQLTNRRKRRVVYGFTCDACGEETEPDLSKCPKCGGPADNGHDREIPPNPYWCSKCSPGLD